MQLCTHKEERFGASQIQRLLIVPSPSQIKIHRAALLNRNPHMSPFGKED
uniref:Uncharacterized protein n=1 Tax=Arundo donax TaxID=35708 RepID=A0A0A9C0P9_ARUDO